MTQSSTLHTNAIAEASAADSINVALADPKFYWFITGLKRIQINHTEGIVELDASLQHEINASKSTLADELRDLDCKNCSYDAILYCPQTLVFATVVDGNQEDQPIYGTTLDNQFHVSCSLLPVAAVMFNWLTCSGGFDARPAQQKWVSCDSAQPKEVSIDWLTVLDHRNFPIAYQPQAHAAEFKFVLCPARAINLYVLDLHQVYDTPPVNRAFSVVQCWDRESCYPIEILFESDSEEELYAYLVDNALYPNDGSNRPF